MVDVIIPYNKDRGFLKNCISSIKEQTYDQVQIISAFGPSLSVARNFNNGLHECRGEYVKFVTEDDWLPPNAIQDLVDGIGDHPWIYANSYQCDVTHPDFPEPSDIYKPDDHTLAANLERNRIHGGTTLYRTEVLKWVGGMNELLWTAEEYDMHLKLWVNGYIPGYIDKEVYCHRIWGGQKSRQLRRTNKRKRDEEIRRIQSFYSNQV
jgi:glycosyltransferase involved in cell wall biosynthesis